MPNPALIAVAKYLWDWYTTPSRKRASRGRSKKKRGRWPGLWMVVLSGLAALVGTVGPDKLQEWLGQITGRLSGGGGAVAADGAIRVYFTQPGGDPNDPNNIAHAVVKYIDGAKETIDVAAFELDNRIIIDALVRAAKRGVKVRLVTDTDYAKEVGPETLRANSVPVVEDHREALMHNKFMVFDGTAVWTGSMNFTENCAYKNDNHGIYFAVPQLAENYATKFRWMFEDHAFGKLPNRDARIPHPVVKLPDGTVVENYFSPHDHPADHVIKAVGEADHTLDFLAFSFTHDGIARAMAERARGGVKVRGVFEKSQATSGHSEFNALRNLGLPVFIDANPRNMHHKAIMIDGGTTLGGSFNFSQNADRSNDENLVIIRNNPAVTKAFEAEFQRVYDLAKGAAGD